MALAVGGGLNPTFVRDTAPILGRLSMALAFPVRDMELIFFYLSIDMF